MRTNTKIIQAPSLTHEGGAAVRLTPERALRRSVLSCLLFEKEAYEDGQSIADRIVDLVGKVKPEMASALAIESRTEQHLRHVPLLLTSALARHAHGKIVEDTVVGVIQRADELAELLAIHAKVNGVTPDKVKKTLSAPMKRGIARAFLNFDEHQLAKYDRAGAVRLRDALFLSHPKPDTPERQAIWDRLAQNQLTTPDTWEVSLSAGADKKATFERLIREGNLGYLALLRNLRGMVEAGCDLNLVRDAVVARRNGAHRVLPFRFIAAARACPQLEPEIDRALQVTIDGSAPLSGTTAVLVDVSGSMFAPLSARSDLTRADAAAALASVIRGNLRVFSFSNQVIEVPPRRGMAGVDALVRSQPHSGTHLFRAVEQINRTVAYDRIIVITDEQAMGRPTFGWARPASAGPDRMPDPKGIGYVINVASAQHGVGYGAWKHIDGFSESVIRFITTIEAEGE